MSAIRRWVCALFGHSTRLDPTWAVVYHCDRCQRLVPGELARWRQ